jgi:hypothetical protein
VRLPKLLSAAPCLLLCAVAALAQTPAYGPEFVVNTSTNGEQDYSAVAMSPAGDFVVTWGGYQGPPPPPTSNVYGQRFDVFGARQGGEFVVNSHLTGLQYDSNVAMDGSGNFVVAWTSYGQEAGTGAASGIYGQRFDASGSPQGSEFHVNTYTADYQYFPSLAGNAAGAFVIAWQSYGQDGSGYGIFGQRFNAAGVPQGSEFRANSYTTGYQVLSDVAMDPAGNFVVAWASKQQDGSDYGIFARRFNSSGVPQGTEFRINTYTTGAQDDPQIAADSSGGFVVTWASVGQLGLPGEDVFGRRYDATGTPIGGEFLINTYTTGSQQYQGVSVDSAGNFVAVWERSSAIFGQRFDAAGRRVGGEFQVSADTTASQSEPDTALDDAGNFVVTWHRNGGDGSGYGVIGRRLEFRMAGVMKVDEPSAGGVSIHAPTASNSNGVLEPGETVSVEPTWTNTLKGTQTVAGAASGFAGPAGGAYTLDDATADYGSIAEAATADCRTATGNCYQMTVSGSPRPATHWDATFLETLDNAISKNWTLHVGGSFTDVPVTHPFYKKIETLLHGGITAGCTATAYCPGDPVSRGQMSLFVARGIAGNPVAIPTQGLVGNKPYNCVAGGASIFTDVLPTDIFCKSVHYIAAQNVTLGCSATQYCPAGSVTRLEMAAFVAKAVVAPAGGPGVPLTYGPDPLTGLSYSCDAASPSVFFTDVPASNGFCKHVHFLWAKGIISGCGGTLYCPGDLVTRDAMAKFLTNGFSVRLYGP